MTASHSPIESAPASCRRGVVPTRSLCSNTAQAEAQAQQQRVGDRAGDQRKLDPEQRRRGVLGRADREQQHAGRQREREARDRDRQQDAAQRGKRHGAPDAEQAQVERHDRAEQQGKPDDMAGIDERIDPERLPQGAGERGALQRGRELHQHRSSRRPVAPSDGRTDSQDRMDQPAPYASRRCQEANAPRTARRPRRRWSHARPSCGSRHDRRSGRPTP